MAQGTGNGKKGGMATCLIIGGVVGCLGIGVVGILAAIAVPNFMKYQCKSKQSEVRSNLMGLYTSEKAFYAEYNHYTSDLVAIDWTPFGTPAYVYGFAYSGPEGLKRADSPTDYDDERRDTLHEAVVANGSFKTDKMLDLDGGRLLPDDLPEDSWAEKDRFKAAAVGDVKKDSEGRLDVWTIDDQRNLVNVTDDCAL